jgi:RNA polymerase sigma-70 factor, ECF subfamily
MNSFHNPPPGFGRRVRRGTFDEALAVSDRRPDLVALDDALDTLAGHDDRKARVVELRFFGGLTNEEIAAALDVSTDTVTRDWQMAKLWLRRELKKERRSGD